MKSRPDPDVPPKVSNRAAEKWSGAGVERGWNFVRRQADVKCLPNGQASCGVGRECQTGTVYRKFSTRMMSLFCVSNCV